MLLCYLRFNTSHVSINRVYEPGCKFDYTSFNTSHVSINPPLKMTLILCPQVSIHLMFLLIAMESMGTVAQADVSIHLMFLLIVKSEVVLLAFKLFQYISCFY